MMHDTELLCDFGAPGAIRRWLAIDDRVMGGVSRSRMTPRGARTAVFRGTLSRDAGGGFASVRAAVGRRDLTGWSGIAIRCRGDGHTYRLRLRPDAHPEGPTWGAPFPTEEGVWVTVRVPFDAFRPSLRGRPAPEAGALDRGSVASVGLLVGDGQVGDFRLEVAWIGAYRE